QCLLYLSKDNKEKRDGSFSGFQRLCAAGLHDRLSRKDCVTAPEYPYPHQLVSGWLCYLADSLSGRIMDRIVFSVILLFASGISSAQVLNPAKWSWKASASTVKVGDEIDLIFTVAVDDNWYVYANDFDPDCGPLLTTITLNDHPGFKTVGSF